jgi:hypothetical protein
VTTRICRAICGRRDEHHGASAGTVFQRPFSTGELEIAGFEDNTSDGRSPSQPTVVGSTPPPSARARAQGLPEGAADVRVEGGGRQRRPLQYDVFYRREGRRRGSRSSAAVGPDRRVGHDVGARRHLLREGQRDRRAVELPATALVGEFESVSFDIDNTPPVVEVQSRRAARRARR